MGTAGGLGSAYRRYAAPPDASPRYDPEWGGARVTIEAIAKFTRACIYGRRGLMGSDPVTAASRTAAEQVADLAEFVETTDVETPMVLIGYSWGGELARLFACENPRAISGLVLVDSRHLDNDADGHRRDGLSPGVADPMGPVR